MKQKKKRSVVAKNKYSDFFIKKKISTSIINKMDFIGGLATAGNFLNEREQPKSIKTHTSRIKRSKPNGNNIYNSWNLKQNRRHVKKKANDRYKLARNTKETGIVPNFYNQVKSVKLRKKKNLQRRRDLINLQTRDNGNNNNITEGFNGQDSLFSDEGSMFSAGRSIGTVDSMGNDHNNLFKKSNLISNNRVHERNYEKSTKDTINRNHSSFLNQFEELSFNNPNGPVSANNVHHENGKMADTSKLEMERRLAMDGEYSKFHKNIDMTYGVAKGDEFIHNNMLPFFKQGFGKGYGPDSIMQKKLDDVKQRKMETFSGSSKNIEYRPKTERKPLFNPHVGLTHIYGMPNFTNYFEKRYTPGRERRNEKIHQPVRVTPGLNLGYNEVAKHGYHDSFRPMQKTVDDLRTANNPKISYGSVVIPGLKSVRRPIVPNVAKHRPVTFKELDPRDMQKGTSYYKGPSIYGQYDAPTTNRQITTKAWYSAPNTNATYHKPDSMREMHKISHKENFKYPGPRHAMGVGQEKATTSTANTYHLEPTNRQLQSKRTYTQPAHHHEGQKHVAFDMNTNIPDPTCRDLTQNKTWNNPAHHHEGQKHIAFDMNTNIPDPTLRDLTQNTTWNNPAHHHEGQKHVAFDMDTNIPDPTLRDLTQNRTWNNPVNRHEAQKHIAFDMNNNIPDQTLRDLTQNRTWNNPATRHEGQKHIAFDMNTNIPDPTLRDLTQNRTWNNPATRHEGQKHIAFDMNTNIPDPTCRDLTQNRTWNNPAHHHEGNKKMAFDYANAIPDTTLKQLTQYKTYQAQAVHHEAQKGGYVAELGGTIAPTTLRQLTQNQQYLNHPSLHEGQKGGYAAEHAGTIAKTTLRQLTQDQKYLNHPVLHEGQKGGYTAAHAGTVAKTTLRQLTQNQQYLNHPVLHEGQKGGYIAAEGGTIAPTTLRQLTQHKTYQGPIGLHQGQKGGYTAAQSGTIAPTTLRQTTQHKTYQGPIGLHQGQKGGYIAAEAGTIAPTTLRQTTQYKTYQGPLGLHEGQKGGYIAAEAGTVAPTTLRQLTQYKTHYNPVSLHEGRKGGYLAAEAGTVAPTTLRQLTQHNTYQGPLTHHQGQKQRGRGDASNSLVNVQKEKTVITRDGGAPTTSNFEKTPTYEHTMVQLCEPIQINREVYGNMEGQRPLQCVPTMHTRVPNQLPNALGWRFDTCVVKQLATNPYINNTQHKSIDY
jgi:hypothetical protein